jgi:hypothetical protein
MLIQELCSCALWSTSFSVPLLCPFYICVFYPVIAPMFSGWQLTILDQALHPADGDAECIRRF